jgi:hypothetical protein
MQKTDSTRQFGGKKYRFLCWVSSKSSVDWFKQRAKLNGVLMRVTKGKPSVAGTGWHGYDLWTRSPK